MIVNNQLLMIEQRLWLESWWVCDQLASVLFWKTQLR
jgi:hypothetical protein